MSMIAKQRGKFWGPGHPMYPYFSYAEEKSEKRHEKTVKAYQRRIQAARSFFDKMMVASAFQHYMSHKTRNSYWTGKTHVIGSEKLINQFTISIKAPAVLEKINIEEPINITRLEYADTATSNMGI